MNTKQIQPDSDLELIKLIKERNDEPSLKILVDRHLPMFLSLYKKYSNALESSGLCKDNLFREKDYVVYKSALSFQDDKGSKFSTWLYNQFRFEFLNQMNKNSDLVPTEESKLFYLIENSQINKEKSMRNINDYIFTILESLSDKRICKIYSLRYFSDKKLVPWSKIAKELNISTQTAINLHNKGINIIKNKVESKNYFDRT